MAIHTFQPLAEPLESESLREQTTAGFDFLESERFLQGEEAQRIAMCTQPMLGQFENQHITWVGSDPEGIAIQLPHLLASTRAHTSIVLVRPKETYLHLDEQIRGACSTHVVVANSSLGEVMGTDLVKELLQQKDESDPPLILGLHSQGAALGGRPLVNAGAVGSVRLHLDDPGQMMRTLRDAWEKHTPNPDVNEGDGRAA